MVFFYKQPGTCSGQFGNSLYLPSSVSYIEGMNTDSLLDLNIRNLNTDKHRVH